ncbi:MAG: response regulator [Vallitalea sp.]|jgi:two-component system response regulator YesN|nr:response regulator [Vallitalea sp.]
MLKLILVDDEIAIRTGLCKVINWDEYGIEIVGLASDGKEALEMIIETKPDIIISDIRMPVMSGIDMLKNLKKMNLNAKVIFISGYNDFEYVKQGIKYGIENYLLKPIDKEELEQTIDTVIQKIDSEVKNLDEIKKSQMVLKNNIFNRLILGKINYSEILVKSEVIGLDNIEAIDTIILSCIDIDNVDTLNLIHTVEVLNDKLARYSNNLICFKNYSNRIILIFINVLDYRDILKSVFDEMKAIVNTDFLITVSNEIHDLMDLNNAYNQALQIQLYSIINQNKILFYSDINKNKYLEMDYIYIRKLFTDERKELLYNYFIKNLNHIIDNKMKPDLIYNMVFEIIMNGLNIIKDLKGSIYNIYEYPENIMNCIMNLKSVDEIKIWTKNILMKMQNYIYELSYTCYSSLVNKMITYVNENIAQEISLKTISNLFNYNGVYMGRVFKNETGELFGDYVNRTRIEYSLELLKNKNISTLEIANKSGFTSSNYYYKVFKKYKGTTPTEYRNHLL